MKRTDNMLIDDKIKLAEQYFKYRKQILEAVKIKRQELSSKSGIIMPKNKYHVTDPTAHEAIHNLERIESVKIYPKDRPEGIAISDPEEWLEVIETVYSEYKNKSIGIAVKNQMEKKMSANVLSGLMGVTRTVYYSKRKLFFVDAVFLAQERNLFKKTKSV